MIRIKNIARENRKIGKLVGWLNIPNGQRIRILPKRELVIDYETYLLNQDSIVLPGEDMLPTTCFRVVRGAENILNKTFDNERDQVVEVQVSPVSSIEGEDGLADEVAHDEEATSPDPNLDDDVELYESEEVDDGIEPEEPAEVDDEYGQDIVEDKVDKPEYDLNELMELSHKELDALLEEIGVTVPPRSNKTVKAEAIISFHLTG